MELRDLAWLGRYMCWRRCCSKRGKNRGACTPNVILKARAHATWTIDIYACLVHAHQVSCRNSKEIRQRLGGQKHRITPNLTRQTFTRKKHHTSGANRRNCRKQIKSINEHACVQQRARKHEETRSASQHRALDNKTEI